MDRKQISKKYRLTCTAPNELSEYDKKRNDSLKIECKNHRSTYAGLFDPSLECNGCRHLDVKGYK